MLCKLNPAAAASRRCPPFCRSAFLQAPLTRTMARRLPALLGVVGAGQMGAGIAQVAASSGLQVGGRKAPAATEQPAA